MKIALLDTNIYDLLSDDPSTRKRINTLIEQALLKIIVTRTVWEELSEKPFFGIPKFFPVEFTANTVGVAGIMCAGDSIGSGDVFFAHLGESRKTNDALIVDAASWKADWLVTEDVRLRNRANDIPSRCKALSYIEFIRELQSLSQH